MNKMEAADRILNRIKNIIAYRGHSPIMAHEEGEEREELLALGAISQSSNPEAIVMWVKFHRIYV